MNRWLAIVAVTAALSLFSPNTLFAQATDGNVVGTIFDAAGAAVPNANVQLENRDTGVRTETRTNNDGQYRFNNVPVGRYNLTGSATGFTSASLANLEVRLNLTSTANLTMQVGTVSTNVEVTEAAALIDTTTAQVQNTFETRQVVELPQSSTGGLGALNLSLLGAGVASSGGVGYGTGPSVGGQRPTNNSFNIEGVDNNDRGVTGPVLYLSNEATQQFTLLQNQYNPEFGHSSGGIFNSVVKNGTNEFHGSLYNYLQNRLFNALDVTEKRILLTEKPRSDQNRLGVTAGGAIVRNKLFYFGNLEYNPIGRAGVPASAVRSPTAEGYRLLSTIPGISRTNLGILQQYATPAPIADSTTKVSNVDIPIGLFPIVAPNYENNYFLTTAGDWNISERDQLRIRYIYNRYRQIDTAATLPVFYSLVPTNSHLVSLNEYHTFSPTITNELRLSYSRKFNDFPVGEFAFPGLDQFPNLYFQDDLNLQLGPDPNAPQSNIQNTYQLVDNVSWTTGRHTIKFGYDGRKVIAPSFFVQRSRGDYNYSNIEGYLLDRLPDVIAERSVGGFPFSGDLWSHYAFLNDDFKLRSNLSLNLGIRYEYVDVPYGSKLQRLNELSSVPGLVEFREPKVQKSNWAPRLGLAYSPGTNGKTSIRAGFGMAYDQVYQNLGTLALPPQFSSTVNVTDPNTANFLQNGGIKNSLAGTSLSVADARELTSALVPDQQRPYSIQWNASIQHVFRQDFTAEIRYLGSRGVHLPVQSRISSVAPVTAQRNLPLYYQRPSNAELNSLPLTLANLQAVPTNSFSSFGFANNITAFLPAGNSSYHGLATELRRRFANGLYFVAAYTWSHNIDDSTAAVFSTLLTPRRPEDFQNLRKERSSSALDRRHRFSYTGVYELPFFTRNSNILLRNVLGNLSLNGTYTYESPAYATVQSGVDSNLNGDAAADRAVVNLAGNPAKGSEVTALLNSAQQTVAYLANDPTAGYIRARQGMYTNAGRNTIALRPINNVDLSAYKRISFSENLRLDLGIQLYNAFNHAQFVPGYISDVRPRANVTTRNNLIPGLPEFNNPETAFSSNPRVVQFVGKFIW